MAENRELKANEKSESKDEKYSHQCGFCPASFLTTEALYAHQRQEHDPDGIMFSEIGLPK